MTATRLALPDDHFLSYIKYPNPGNRQIVIRLCKNIAAAQHSIKHAKSTFTEKIDAAHYPEKLKG